MMLPLISFLVASSLRAIAPDSTMRGRLFIDGREIQGPFTFARSRDTLLINGRSLLSYFRPLPPSPTPRPMTPRERAIARLDERMRKQVRVWKSAGLADSAVAESVASMLRSSSLFYRVAVGNRRTVVYRETRRSSAVLIDLSTLPPPVKDSSESRVDAQIRSLRRVLDRGGVVIAGGGAWLYAPAGRASVILEEIEKLRSGVRIPESERLLVGPMARAFQPDSSNPAP
jgi:hypothetical protein